jgi:heme oxygenase
MNSAARHPISPLHALLRAGTAAAHRSLEDSLALLQEPLDRGRFIAVLLRLHGFHQAWEPAIARRLAPPLLPPSRIGLFEHDLKALGIGAPAIAGIAACSAAERLGDHTDTALGSLYVLEGSTLGGRVIGAKLRRAPWCPRGGLRSFEPYGAGTAARWRATLAQLERSGGDAQRIVDGALRTFHTLQRWLVVPATTA